MPTIAAMVEAKSLEDTSETIGIVGVSLADSRVNLANSGASGIVSAGGVNLADSGTPMLAGTGAVGLADSGVGLADWLSTGVDLDDSGVGLAN
jgi:hypothetical protein